MYLPRMIYKGGKASPQVPDYRVINTMDELWKAIGEGFFPTGHNSVESLMEIPELSEAIKAKFNLAKQEKQIEETIEKMFDNPEIQKEIIEEPKPIIRRSARRIK